MTCVLLQSCQLAVVEPQKHDGGLTCSNPNINYHPAAPPRAVCGLYHCTSILLYCYRICLDIMSIQPMLWAVIWAICTEIDRCPHVISDSGIGLSIFCFQLQFTDVFVENSTGHRGPASGTGKRGMTLLFTRNCLKVPFIFLEVFS